MIKTRPLRRTIRLSRWRPRSDFNELRIFIGPASFFPRAGTAAAAIFGADHKGALRRRQWRMAGHSGAPPKVASPESIALGRLDMDSGLAVARRPGMPACDSNFETAPLEGEVSRRVNLTGRSSPADLAADRIFLPIEQPLFAAGDVTAVLPCHEALLLADRVILGMKRARLAGGDFAFAAFLIDAVV